MNVYYKDLGIDRKKKNLVSKFTFENGKSIKNTTPVSEIFAAFDPEWCREKNDLKFLIRNKIKKIILTSNNQELSVLSEYRRGLKIEKNWNTLAKLN